MTSAAERDTLRLTPPSPTSTTQAGPAEALDGERQFRDWHPEQGELLPQHVRRELGEDHLACFFMDLRPVLDFGAILASYKSERGYPPYNPVMMTLLLMYSYARGVTSSREIERRCVTDLAYRYIAGGGRPDHDTICYFRVRHLAAFKALFVETTRLARELKVMRLGHLSIDGTKVKANASKHKAMSYGRMEPALDKLDAQIDELLKDAERIDAEESRRHGRGRGDELPASLADPKARAQQLRAAKARLAEADKKVEVAVEKEARAEKIAESKTALEEAAREKAKAEGKDPEQAKPDDKAQRNFTDPESRIMPTRGGFEQAYNAQVAVEAGALLIAAECVTQQTNDAGQLAPMVKQAIANTTLTPSEVSADAGYLSERDVTAVEALGPECFVATGRQKHGEVPKAPRGRTPAALTWTERMARKLRTKRGRRKYANRKVTAEPGIGLIKNRGFRTFSMRGLVKARGEFSLVCAVHNLVRLFHLGAALPAAA